MPVISLAEVAANRRTIEVDLGLPALEDGSAQTLTVTYRVNTVTPADELRFATVKTGAEAVPEEQMNDLFGFAGRLIEKWGLTGPLTALDGAVVVAAGKPVPMEPAALKVLPSSILTAVLKACMTDINDPKASTPSAVS
jgi:hypothetical protein